ncbi:nuclear transport factor 2 family protein [Mycolicibacterium neworleansense]|uniref:SnoaL-like domain protein n=1 Tax=Mycolicibacterium neworleansense TaxID=146018 RepID=A0A0H5RS52_9MYCO|nr:nuclear transport factor 2 family protein [Mycolicibacterium neworleansense]MCV7361634.1 nuclear transport factor 2 family protein [Mycolicibacterium neworleansense]CRZ16990.1 SnoaL-like domain protein [Mycolicibacterium neworleansense]
MSGDISGQLPAVVQRYVDAVNAFDTDAVLATFAADAVVNDNHREFADRTAIRTWIAGEITGDRVTMEVTEADVRPGVIVLRARYDGEFDKTDLPAELILTSYIVVRDDAIAALFIAFDTGDETGTVELTV